MTVAAATPPLTVGTPPPSANTGAGAGSGAASTSGSGDGTGKSTPSGSTGQSGNTPATASAVAADVSFTASGPQYMMKLIYLPDYQHPMGLTSSTGLWGSSSFQPTLQDGWMLTSLNATADAKTAETLTALGSIASTIAGGGAGAAAKAVASAATTTTPPPGGESTGKTPSALEQGMLRPGLYKFVFDDKGKLTGLTAVSFFDISQGVVDQATSQASANAAAVHH